MNPFSSKPKSTAVALLNTPITFQRSVVHSCAQANFKLLNECMGIADHPDSPTIADEYLATEDGKALMRGLKGYMLYAMGKTM